MEGGGDKQCFSLYFLGKLQTYLKLSFTYKRWVMSLEVRPLAALYPHPHIYFQTDTIEKGANAAGMSIPPPAYTESGDRERSSSLQPYKANFLY